MAYKAFDPGEGYLSTYEVVPFTPTLGASGSDGSVTYSTQVGYYARIGKNHCYIAINIVWSAWSGSSGDMLIKNLPFTSQSTSTITPGLAYRTSGLPMNGSDTCLVAYVVNNSTTIQVASTASGSSASNIAAGDAAATISLSGIYDI